MPMTFVKPEELDSYVGKSLEPSEWLTIDQERINNFADATNDHQFIHVDPEQAAPIFGSTIAHGFLSLSLATVICAPPAIILALWLATNTRSNLLATFSIQSSTVTLAI